MIFTSFPWYSSRIDSHWLALPRSSRQWSTCFNRLSSLFDSRLFDHNDHNVKRVVKRVIMYIVMIVCVYETANKKGNWVITTWRAFFFLYWFLPLVFSIVRHASFYNSWPLSEYQHICYTQSRKELHSIMNVSFIIPVTLIFTFISLCKLVNFPCKHSLRIFCFSLFNLILKLTLGLQPFCPERHHL